MKLFKYKFLPFFLTLFTAAVISQEIKSKSSHVSQAEIETLHVSSGAEMTRVRRQLPADINSGDIIRDYAYNFLNFMLNYVGILAHTLVTQLFFTA